MKTRRQTGQDGEDAAAAFLLQRGFRIVARNWRSRSLELDIVAEQGDTLIFVEVKTRAAQNCENPFDAVTPTKQATLCRAATAYLNTTGQWHKACRFDVIGITMRDGAASLEHIPDAFEFSPIVDSRHAAWQPW